MNNYEERLDEYVDGLLTPAETREVEAALAEDPLLREALERARRFSRLLDSQTPDARAVESVMARLRARKRPLWLLAVPLMAAAAALALLLLRPPEPPPTYPQQVLAEMETAWLAFGDRLGEIALERREGRVPRTGVGGLETPPAAAYGIVFKGALVRLNVRLEEAPEAEVLRLVRRHHEAMRRRGRGLLAECERAEASLKLYRDLSRVGGEAVADAYYDVFRPGRTDLETTERVRPDNLQFVVQDYERYREACRRAIEDLNGRFGEPNVALVVDQLAPLDERDLWYDPALAGVGREAVLEIRAQLYETARDAGADKLYVEG